MRMIPLPISLYVNSRPKGRSTLSTKGRLVTQVSSPRSRTWLRAARAVHVRQMTKYRGLMSLVFSAMNQNRAKPARVLAITSPFSQKTLWRGKSTSYSPEQKRQKDTPQRQIKMKAISLLCLSLRAQARASLIAMVRQMEAMIKVGME